jgi:DNA-binding protein HU-beta
MPTTTQEQRMTKPELAKQVAAVAGLIGEQAKSAGAVVFDTIASELAAGHDVAIAAFGKFSVADRAAREGRTPRRARRSRSPRAVARSSPQPLASSSSSTADRGPGPGRYRAPGPSPTLRRRRAGPRRGGSIRRSAAVIGEGAAPRRHDPQHVDRAVPCLARGR